MSIVACIRESIVYLEHFHDLWSLLEIRDIDYGVEGSSQSSVPQIPHTETVGDRADMSENRATF